MSLIDKFKNWKPQKQRELLEQLLAIHAGTEYSNALYGGLQPVNVSYHPTPEAIHEAYWGPICAQNGVPYDIVLTNVAFETGTNGIGEQVGNTPEQVIEGIRTQGCWAFTHYDSRTVHVWADAAVGQDMLMQMIAGEVAHLTPDRLQDEQLEELRAIQMGNVAQVSQAIFNQLMEDRAHKLEG